MSKQKTLILFIFLCSLIVLSFSHQSQLHTASGQTIPSPTPVPSDTPVVPTTDTPTDTPEPSATATPDDGGNGNNPQPTQPGPTATPTLIPASTLAPTPEGGYLPTAAPCDDSPTIQAFNNLNVRLGPGIDYDIIDRVIFYEVRPIIGRSQYGQWWLIELADGRSGWVADAVGLVQGYIGNVPVVAAPPLNGQTPTPGAPWQPTPRPSCTVTPTYTPSPTVTASPTPPPTATATAVSEATPTATTISEATPTLTVTPEATKNEAEAATRIASLAVSEDEPTPISEARPTAYPIQPTATPLEEEVPARTPNLLPIVGLVLVAGGIFAAIARRQFSKP